MFKWKKEYKFNFSELGPSDKVGVNDVGIGVFKNKPYIGLTKEILQNSTDAAAPYDGPEDQRPPVKVRFELTYIDRDDIPDADNLKNAIEACYEYYSDGADGEKLKLIRDAAEKYLSKPGKIPVLKISDYNTTGLCGVHEEKGSNWSGLVRERSATNKTNGDSGAYGVGKFAPFTFSSVRTIFYFTKTIDGETAFQGKALLTTFKDKKGILRNNIGLFAREPNEEYPNYDAVFNEEDIAPVFCRKECGTDIFVLGFEKEPKWMELTALSVLEHFFYSIYKGKLEVTVAEEGKCYTINQENLQEQMDFFENYYKDNLKDDPSFRFTAPLYLTTIKRAAKNVIREHFRYNRKDMGEYELYLLTERDYPAIIEKGVLEMRQAGMKICEDSAFRIQLNFAGVFIATGKGAASDKPEDNISSFLRKCENQAHNAWSADEYPEEKEKAKGIINLIHKNILDAVKKQMPQIDEGSVDAFGLSEFLPNTEEEDDKKEEESFANFTPLSFEVQSIKSKKIRRQIDISIRTNGGSKHKKTANKENGKKNRHRNNGKGYKRGKAAEIPLSKIKTPYNNASGEYVLSFIPEKEAKDLWLQVKIGSEDDNLEEARIISAVSDNTSLLIKDGKINVGAVSQGEKKILHIKLAEDGRYTLEVHGYAKC